MTPAEHLENRIIDNERLQRQTERACEGLGYMTRAAAAVLTELSLEHEVLSERLAEITA